MSIRIDPEFQAMIYSLSDEESAQLETNILAEGCRDPLVVWKEEQILLDGHHRKRICESHNLPYHVSELSLPDRYAATVWIINHQLGRRNLTPNQASDLRGQRYKIERIREGSGAPEGNQYAEKQKSDFRTSVLDLEPDIAIDELPSKGDTAQRLADEYGVARSTIHEDAKFSEALDTLAKDISPTMRQTMTTPLPKPTPSIPTNASPTNGHLPGPAHRAPPALIPRPTKQKIIEVAHTVKEQQVTLLPFMKRGRWPDHALLEAMSVLGGIPQGEHLDINTFLDEDGIPFDIALKILRNLRAFPDERRQTIYTLHASTDPREVSLSKTMAIGGPPSPDPQVLRATAIIRTLSDGQAAIAKWMKDWPLEPWVKILAACQVPLQQVIHEIESIKHQAKEAHHMRTERYADTTDVI